MKKVHGIRAVLPALVLGLLWPCCLEARTHHKGARKKATQTSPKSAGKQVPGPRHTLKTGKKGPSVAAHPARKRRAKRIIRRGADNQVVLDWIQTARSRQIYGPLRPPSEAFDFPSAPCPPVDVVLEARVHDGSLDSPEPQVPEEGLETEDAAARQSRVEHLVAIAKRIGSFLRPKSASARVSEQDLDLAVLLSANLKVPVEGVDAERLRDSFLERRGRYRKHLAIDIGAPRDTPVVATSDGEIMRLRREKRGGISIYQKDPTGKYLFFYCHLSRYAAGLTVGQKVSAGETIGYVGSTGHVIGGPHLHFSITRVPEDDDFREGLAVNPYLLFLAGVP